MPAADWSPRWPRPPIRPCLWGRWINSGRKPDYLSIDRPAVWPSSGSRGEKKPDRWLAWGKIKEGRRLPDQKGALPPPLPSFPLPPTPLPLSQLFTCWLKAFSVARSLVISGTIVGLRFLSWEIFSYKIYIFLFHVHYTSLNTKKYNIQVNRYLNRNSPYIYSI